MLRVIFLKINVLCLNVTRLFILRSSLSRLTRLGFKVWALLGPSVPAVNFFFHYFKDILFRCIITTTTDQPATNFFIQFFSEALPIILIGSNHILRSILNIRNERIWFDCIQRKRKRQLFVFWFFICLQSPKQSVMCSH